MKRTAKKKEVEAKSEQKGFKYFLLTGMWLQPTKVRGQRFYKGTLGNGVDVLLFHNISSAENAPEYNLVLSRKVE